VSKPPLDATGYCVQRVPGDFSLGLKRPQREVDYSFLSAAMNEAVLPLPSSCTQGQVYFTLLYQECYFLSGFLDQKCF